MLTPRLLRALPLLVAVVTLWLAGPEALPSALLVVASIAAVLVGPRLPIDKPTQRLASLVVIILVIAGVRAAGIPLRGPRLGAFAFGFAIAPLAVATLRLTFAKPEWGYPVTAVLGFVGMMACGATRLGPIYGALVAAYLAATITALRVDDVSRVPAHRVPRRAAAVGALIVMAACGLAIGSAMLLRPIQAYAQRRLERSLEEYMLSRGAFSDAMRLGKMTRLLKSDRVVLRIRGARVDWLRGAVLDHYDGRRWLRQGGGVPLPITVGRGPIAGANVVEIRKVGDDGDRLFLPYAFDALTTPSGSVSADEHGIVRVGRDAPLLAWVRVPEDGRTRGVLPVARYGPTDLEVSRELEGPLQTLASHWARGATRPEEALVAIERHLRADFSYAVDHERKTKLDPILDFLFEHRVGHCEYFASAMTLMARSIGIPARVVTGYRVAERNPYLGHYVVRERNAHAWVEAWSPEGGWRTFDPTPMVELGHNEPHEEGGLAALTELARAGVTRVEDWLAERTVIELSIAAVIGLVLFGIVRARGAKKADESLAISRALTFSPPLDAYVALEAKLGRDGFGRAESEPLEGYAARVPSPARELVLRYVEVRYGGKVDAALEADLRAGLPRSTDE